jgi:ubiquinone/menaquinone biosynthesis C-methylase UbiE
MKQEIIKQNLKQIETGYDLIAKKFSETRKYFWHSLEFTKQYVKEGDKILDFGCGNGRLLELFNNKNIYYKGIDSSQKLIDFAKKQYPKNRENFIKINPTELRLPFNTKEFNSIYSIATFHHLPGKNHRQKIAEELYRVAKKDSWIIITVWDLWQSRYRQKIFKNWLNKIIGKSKLDWNDCQITFTDNEENVFNRYHHAFTKGELERLFRKTGFNIIKTKKIRGNIVLVGQKSS